MKKYRTMSYSFEIEKVEIDRETEKSVFFGKNRHAKKSEFLNYFNYFQSAKDFLIKRKLKEIESLEKQMISSKKDLAEIQSQEKSVDNKW